MTDTTSAHAEALRQKIAEAYEQIANLSDIARWGYQDEINVLHALITDYEAALVKIAPPTPDAHYEPIRADELKVGDYIKYHAEWREILDVKCKTGLVSVTIDDRPRPLVFLPDVQVSTVIAHAVLPSTALDIADIRSRLKRGMSGLVSSAHQPTDDENLNSLVEAYRDINTLLDALTAANARIAELEAKLWTPGEIKATRCPICNGLLRRIGPDSYSHDVWKCDDCESLFSSGVGGTNPADTQPSAPRAIDDDEHVDYDALYAEPTPGNDETPAPTVATTTTLPRLTKAQIKGLKVLAAQTKQPTPVWRMTSHGCVHSGVAKVLVRHGLAETVRDGRNGSIRITAEGKRVCAALAADTRTDGGV